MEDDYLESTQLHYDNAVSSIVLVFDVKIVEQHFRNITQTRVRKLYDLLRKLALSIL